MEVLAVSDCGVLQFPMSRKTISVPTEKGESMNDLISRKALLAEYDRVHIGEPGMARKLIEDAPAIQEWIPVTERLPKEFIAVLICVPKESPLPIVKPAYLANGEWRANLQIFDQEEVTHWMPWPEPPKEG